MAGVDSPAAQENSQVCGIDEAIAIQVWTAAGIARVGETEAPQTDPWTCLGGEEEVRTTDGKGLGIRSISWLASMESAQRPPS